MLKSRRYRNRRLGDFLKELDLTEGRSTGVPTIQTKLAENGSPRAIFETTKEQAYNISSRNRNGNRYVITRSRKANQKTPRGRSHQAQWC